MIPLVPKINLAKRGSKDFTDAAKFIYNNTIKKAKAIPTVNKTIKTARIIDTGQDATPAIWNIMTNSFSKQPIIKQSPNSKYNKTINKRFDLSTTSIPTLNFKQGFKQ